VRRVIFGGGVGRLRWHSPWTGWVRAIPKGGGRGGRVTSTPDRDLASRRRSG
jgi:hypothetical protein